MLRQGHLRNGANLRPDGPGESKVVESSECDKECVSGNARNDNKTFYEYLILGGKRKVDLTSVEKEEKRAAKNKRAKETRDNKKKLLPPKSNIPGGGLSSNGPGSTRSTEVWVGVGDVDKPNVVGQRDQLGNEQGVGESTKVIGREKNRPKAKVASSGQYCRPSTTYWMEGSVATALVARGRRRSG